jgi:hypothetical protein
MNAVYTFVDNNGTNIHINSEGLRLWCIANKPEIFWLPMNEKVAQDFVRDNVISLDRVKELSTRKNLDPIIMVKDGTFGSNGHPNAMLVDGHHRYFLTFLRKQPFIEGYFLEESQWRPFQIHWLRDISAEELKRRPVTKRNY